MSPAVVEKAARYLAEGRLTVHARGGQIVRATCAGGSKYTLGYSPRGGWYCTCPSRRACAHVLALQLVTTSRRAAS